MRYEKAEQAVAVFRHDTQIFVVVEQTHSYFKGKIRPSSHKLSRVLQQNSLNDSEIGLI
jgi:hypothetical protein